jgi:hypothetical protein
MELFNCEGVFGGLVLMGLLENKVDETGLFAKNRSNN